MDSDSDSDMLTGARPLREIPGDTMMVDADGLFAAIAEALNGSSMTKEQRMEFVRAFSASIEAVGATLLHKTGDETATGIKTFSNGIRCSSVEPSEGDSVFLSAAAYAKDDSDSDSDSDPDDGDRFVTAKDIDLDDIDVPAVSNAAGGLAAIYRAIGGTGSEDFGYLVQRMASRCGVSYGSLGNDLAIEGLVDFLVTDHGSDSDDLSDLEDRLASSELLNKVYKNLIAILSAYVNGIAHGGSDSDSDSDGSDSDADDDGSVCSELAGRIGELADAVKELEDRIDDLEDKAESAEKLREGFAGLDKWIIDNNGEIPVPVVNVSPSHLITAFEDLVYENLEQ